MGIVVVANTVWVPVYIKPLSRISLQKHSIHGGCQANANQDDRTDRQFMQERAVIADRKG